MSRILKLKKYHVSCHLSTLQCIYFSKISLHLCYRAKSKFLIRFTCYLTINLNTKLKTYNFVRPLHYTMPLFFIIFPLALILIMTRVNHLSMTTLESPHELTFKPTLVLVIYHALPMFLAILPIALILRSVDCRIEFSLALLHSILDLTYVVRTICPSVFSLD